MEQRTDQIQFFERLSFQTLDLPLIWILIEMLRLGENNLAAAFCWLHCIAKARNKADAKRPMANNEASMIFLAFGKLSMFSMFCFTWLFVWYFYENCSNRSFFRLTFEQFLSVRQIFSGQWIPDCACNFAHSRDNPHVHHIKSSASHSQIYAQPTTDVGLNSNEYVIFQINFYLIQWAIGTLRSNKTAQELILLDHGATPQKTKAHPRVLGPRFSVEKPPLKNAIIFSFGSSSCAILIKISSWPFDFISG